MTAKKEKNEPIESLSFENALIQLEKIVRDLETGQAPLEKSISAYERGIALKKHCEEKLRDAQAKIEKITVSQNGTISTEPLDE
ncbi:MAG: exodeoxyribonuclease VII small subunit [Alphaproteobacteria bacterium]|nr:exodeoxyribonuclease VII small subunit [Alphaproteobacteria bacterium]